MELLIVGDAERITIPNLSQEKKGVGRLRGQRLLHTHLNQAGLSQEDLMDLLFLRLDLLACLCVDANGFPTHWQYAKLDPNQSDPPYQISKLLPWDALNCDLATQVAQIETQLAKTDDNLDTAVNQNAILVSVNSLPTEEQEKNLRELAKLAETAGLRPKATLIQRLKRIDPRALLGKGKMADLEVLALSNNANTLIFDGELEPAQLHNLADLTERKVLDRTQIILDIFAKHAQSRAGKLQVELAKLRYLSPRLTGQNKALDRLMGGIGGRWTGTRWN